MTPPSTLAGRHVSQTEQTGLRAAIHFPTKGAETPARPPGPAGAPGRLPPGNVTQSRADVVHQQVTRHCHGESRESKGSLWKQPQPLALWAASTEQKKTCYLI